MENENYRIDGGESRRYPPPVGYEVSGILGSTFHREAVIESLSKLAVPECKELSMEADKKIAIISQLSSVIPNDYIFGMGIGSIDPNIENEELADSFARGLIKVTTRSQFDNLLSCGVYDVGDKLVRVLSGSLDSNIFKREFFYKLFLRSYQNIDLIRSSINIFGSNIDYSNNFSIEDFIKKSRSRLLDIEEAFVLNGRSRRGYSDLYEYLVDIIENRKLARRNIFNTIDRINLSGDMYSTENRSKILFWRNLYESRFNKIVLDDEKKRRYLCLPR